MRTISLRVGQVAGSATTGAWNTTDWVPILVKSSVGMGMLPSLTGVRFHPENERIPALTSFGI